MNQNEPNLQNGNEKTDNRLHFSDYFGAPGARLLAVIIGALTGFAFGVFLGWQYGVLIGAGVAIVMSVLIPVMLYRADAPYVRLKDNIQSPFIFDERVRFTVRGGRSVGGFFILTEDKMVFLSIEQGTHRLDLSRKDVKTIVLQEEEYSIRIFLNEKHFIQVVSGVCAEMYDVLRENRWG